VSRFVVFAEICERKMYVKRTIIKHAQYHFTPLKALARKFNKKQSDELLKVKKTLKREEV